MMLRIVTGVTAAALLTSLIFFGNLWMILAVVVACAVLSYLEYDRLFFAVPSTVRHTRQIALIVLTLIGMNLNPLLGWAAFWLSFVVLAAWHVVASNAHGNFERATRDLAFEFLGYLYIVGLFGFLGPIAQLPFIGPHLMFLLFFMVFLGDTGAYFVGSKIGKHRLAEKVSPKKSVEGSVASVLFSFLGAWIWLRFILPGDQSQEFAPLIYLMVPFVSVLGQLGDLFESMLKRSHAIKDSGSFLPGHGGILDRIDSLALVAPAFYLYLMFILGH